MQERHVSFEQVTDIIAFRIVTPTDADCYAALGLIHRKWKMVPGRFKDYISTPKRNGYKSLHTTIMPQPNMRIEIGRATVRTPVTNAPLVCLLRLENTTQKTK